MIGYTRRAAGVGQVPADPRGHGQDRPTCRGRTATLSDARQILRGVRRPDPGRNLAAVSPATAICRHTLDAERFLEHTGGCAPAIGGSQPDLLATTRSEGIPWLAREHGGSRKKYPTVDAGTSQPFAVWNLPQELYTPPLQRLLTAIGGDHDRRIGRLPARRPRPGDYPGRCRRRHRTERCGLGNCRVPPPAGRAAAGRTGTENWRALGLSRRVRPC